MSSRSRRRTGASASTSRWAIPSGRLVEQDHRRSVRHEAREVDDSPGAGRQFADHVMTVLRQTDQLDQLVVVRWRSPPRSRTLWEMEGGRRARRGCRSTGSRDRRFSLTVISGNIRRSWNERPSPRRARRRGQVADVGPSSAIRPPSACVKPEIRSNSVVLPAPFGPMMPTISRSWSDERDVVDGLDPAERTWRSETSSDRCRRRPSGVVGRCRRRRVSRRRRRPGRPIATGRADRADRASDR